MVIAKLYNYLDFVYNSVNFYINFVIAITKFN